MSAQLVTARRTPARIEPGLVPALVVFVVYLVVVLGGQKVIAHDVDFNAYTESVENFRKGVIYPIGLASLLLIVVTTWFGWWKPALAEPRTTPRWLMIVPLVGIVGMAINIVADVDLWDDKAFLTTVLVGFALVGFSEELMTRGLLLVGARAQLGKEWQAWLLTTVCFALMHGGNALNGQDGATTAKQVAFVVVPGSLLYVCRRATGSLVVAMVVHGLNDAALTIHAGPGSELNNSTNDPAAAVGLFMLVGVVCTVIALLRKRLRHDNPDADLAPLLAR